MLRFQFLKLSTYMRILGINRYVSEFEMEDAWAQFVMVRSRISTKAATLVMLDRRNTKH